MFISLHNHSHYSLLDGVSQIKPFVKRACELEMPAIGLTDHGTLAGAIEFYLECKKQGIKPIVGVEAYIDDSEDRKSTYRHVVLLAKNYKGYKNLLHIVSESHVNGFYYRPRTTTELIFKYGEGLVVSTACMGGVLAKLKSKREAIREANRWKERFDDDFYIEVMFNELESQKYVNRLMKSVSDTTGIQLLVTHDTHYVEAKDTTIQDFVLLVRSKKTIDEAADVVYKARSLYLMDGAELYKRAKGWKYNFKKKEWRKLLSTSLEIADKVDLKIPMGKFHLPDMGLDKDEFRQLVKREFKRFPFKNKKEYKKRAKRELDIINKLGFHNYFLIVQDMVQWCHHNDVFVGAARGSVAGSLVAFILGITKIDPIRHGLIFERFLNENRVDMPDIDLDFDANKRDRVIAYLRKTYGGNKVAKVITFGTFGQVGALKDVGRVFKLPQRPINEIASVVYKTGSLKEAKGELSGLLKDFWNENKRYMKIAKRISTMIRNAGVHPCGLVIAPKPVYKYCPLQRIKGEVVSAYAEGFKGRELTQVGLIKFDILGLNTCSIISDTIDLVRETKNKDLMEDIWDLDLEDEKLLAEARKGNTVGGFQFESESATKLLRSIKPKSFYEIAALNAINRPGPLASGAVERFANYEGMGLDNKDIARILKETRGTLVYQEQVMRIYHEIAGYPMVVADEHRKRAAKKTANEEYVKKLKKDFLKRCSKEIGRDDARELWKILKEFTQYSFNKSHSVSYTYLFYQVLFLKNYYPREFFVSLLSNTATTVIKNQKKGTEKNKLYRYINEARKYGLKIYGPDINRSAVGFSMEKKGIRFGLSKIKGIKGPTAEEIVEKRPYSSFQDFLNKISGKVHKGKVVALIQAGAFDCFGDRRGIKRMFNGIRKDKVFTLNKSIIEDSVDAFSFILLHPFFFDAVRKYLQKRYCTSSQQLRKYDRWEPVAIAGIILNVDIKMSGKSAIVLKIQDHRGDMFIYLDKDAANRYKGILKPFNVVFINGRLMGGNRILCYENKDKIYNITDKIAKLLEDKSCRRKALI